MLTGCHKSEALTLQWDWVDFERRCLRRPDSKTGPKVTSLGVPDLELLLGLRHIEGNPHVFLGSTDGGHFVGLQKLWTKVRKRAGLEDVRLHDLRHSFAGIGATGGDRLDIVRSLLGHKQAHTTERFVHLADDRLRVSANRIAQQVAAALNRRSGADVIDLPKKGRLKAASRS